MLAVRYLCLVQRCVYKTIQVLSGSTIKRKEREDHVRVSLRWVEGCESNGQKTP